MMHQKNESVNQTAINDGCDNRAERAGASEGGAPPLKLDYIKNNSHPVENTAKNDGLKPGELKRCPNSVGYFQGVVQADESKYKKIRKNIDCKDWGCPYCGPKMAKKLRRRIYKGMIADIESIPADKRKYGAKMLTLTCPGADWRAMMTPETAAAEMAKQYDKLMKAMRKRLGGYHYFRVVEPQRDGFPHYHILLVGGAIACRALKEIIIDLWCVRYGMGFVKLQWLKYGLKGGVNYVVKYLTKGLQSMGKGMRLYSASRGALEKRPPKPRWESGKFYYGVRRSDDECGVVEVDLFPDRPEGLPWERVKLAFQDDIDRLLSEGVAV